MPQITNGGPKRARNRSLGEREGRSCKHRISWNQNKIRTRLRNEGVSVPWFVSKPGFTVVWYWNRPLARDSLIFSPAKSTRWADRYSNTHSARYTIKLAPENEIMSFILFVWKLSRSWLVSFFFNFELAKSFKECLQAGCLYKTPELWVSKSWESYGFKMRI